MSRSAPPPDELAATATITKSFSAGALASPPVNAVRLIVGVVAPAPSAPLEVVPPT